jgi:hypothetical protein
MEEQSPTDPPRDRRPPAKSTPRSRAAKAAFTSPPTDEQQEKSVPRSRSAKAAPPVLFQPPAEDQPPAEHPAPARNRQRPKEQAPADAPAPADAATPVAPAKRKAAPRKATTKRTAAKASTTAAITPAPVEVTAPTPVDVTPQAVVDVAAPTVVDVTPQTAVETTSQTAVEATPVSSATPESPVAAEITAPAAVDATAQAPAIEVTAPTPVETAPETPAAPATDVEAVPASTPTPEPADATEQRQSAPASPVKRAGRAARKTVPPKPRRSPTALPVDMSATDLPAPAPAPAPEPEPAEQPEPRLVGRLLDHPGYAPELLAAAAVEVMGPAAQAWAEQLRATYPAATPDGLARLATRRFVRLAGAGGAVAAAAGLFAPLAELVVVSWTQAGLVLHLAAAYGQDPTHPDRAAELLVLTQVHPDDPSARSALTAARQAVPEGDRALHRVGEAAWRLAIPLAAQAGGWLVLRLAARLMPGAAALAAAAGDSASSQRLAARAIARYRPARATRSTG